MTTKVIDADDEGPNEGKAGSLDSDEENWISITSSEADLEPETSSKIPPQVEQAAATDVGQPMSGEVAEALVEQEPLLDQPKLKIVDDVDSSSSGPGLSEQLEDQSQNESYSS